MTRRYQHFNTDPIKAPEPQHYQIDGEEATYTEWRSDFYWKNYRPDLQRQLDNCATVFDELSQVLNVAEYVDAQKISAHLAFIENELLATVARAVRDGGLREA
jgi:hypothetical protein